MLIVCFKNMLIAEKGDQQYIISILLNKNHRSVIKESIRMYKSAEKKLEKNIIQCAGGKRILNNKQRRKLK